MKKKYLTIGAIAFAFVVATGYGVKSNVSTDSQLSALTKANVEALAWWEDDGGGSPSLWHVIQEDCVFTVEAAAGTEVRILGIPVTANAQGIARLTLHNARVRCQANGNELCELRHCPTLF